MKINYVCIANAFLAARRAIVSLPAPARRYVHRALLREPPYFSTLLHRIAVRPLVSDVDQRTTSATRARSFRPPSNAFKTSGRPLSTLTCTE